MMTRREEQRLERRAAIIEVAAQLFVEKGYGATSMSAVADALGGSKATLWKHFASKEELFAAFIEGRISLFREEVSQTLASTGNVRADLSKAVLHLLRRILSEPSLVLYRLVIGEGGRFPEIGRIFYERGPKANQDAFAMFIQARMSEGELRKGDAQEAAGMVIALCSGGLHQRALWQDSKPTKKEIEAEAEAVVDHFLRSYAAKAPK